MNIASCVFASHNPGKAREVALVLAEFGVHCITVAELEVQKGPAPKPEETAGTYEGNARIKAEAFFKWCQLPSLADDAGLEVAALQGEPGVDSAVYAGPQADSQANIDKLLSALKGVTHREARFVSQLYLKTEHGVYLERAFLEGRIIEEMRGQGGFGYDSVFVPKGESLTLAEIKAERGEGYATHRVKALRALFSKK